MDPDFVGALSVIMCEGNELENLVSRGGTSHLIIGRDSYGAKGNAHPHGII
jgi:hypothetical protein